MAQEWNDSGSKTGGANGLGQGGHGGNSGLGNKEQEAQLARFDKIAGQAMKRGARASRDTMGLDSSPVSID